jgi:hypothetical protein
MIERLGFLAREGEDFFHARGVGDVAGHLGVGAGTDLFFHFDADGFEIEPELLQHVDGDPLPELDQPEEQVFGAHVIMVEAVGFLAREREDLLGAGSKVVHVLSVFFGKGEAQLSDFQFQPTQNIEHSVEFL